GAEVGHERRELGHELVGQPAGTFGIGVERLGGGRRDRRARREPHGAAEGGTGPRAPAPDVLTAPRGHRQDRYPGGRAQSYGTGLAPHRREVRTVGDARSLRIDDDHLARLDGARRRLQGGLVARPAPNRDLAAPEQDGAQEAVLEQLLLGEEPGAPT